MTESLEPCSVSSRGFLHVVRRASCYCLFLCGVASFTEAGKAVVDNPSAAS